MRILHLSALLVWNLDRLLLAMFVRNLVIACCRALAGGDHYDCEGCIDFCVLVRSHFTRYVSWYGSSLPACNFRWESALQPVWNHNISNSRLKLFLPPYYDNLSGLLVILRKKNLFAVLLWFLVALWSSVTMVGRFGFLANSS